jgi:hypothetical protein
MTVGELGILNSGSIFKGEFFLFFFFVHLFICAYIVWAISGRVISVCCKIEIKIKTSPF